VCGNELFPGGAPAKAVLRFFANAFAKEFLSSFSIEDVTLRSACASKFVDDGFRGVGC